MTTPEQTELTTDRVGPGVKFLQILDPLKNKSHVYIINLTKELTRNGSKYFPVNYTRLAAEANKRGEEGEESSLS